MKTLQKSSLALLSILASGLIASSHAAVVTWGSAQNITGVSDVSTTGTLERAHYLTDATPTTTSVNGVTFSSLQNPGGVTNASILTLGNTVITTPRTSINTGFINTEAGGTFQALNANYQAILGYFTFAFQPAVDPDNFTPITLTLNGLTNSQQYQFQVWLSDPRSFSTTRTTSVTAGNSVTLAQNPTQTTGNAGQFVIGTFTADSTSQAFTFAGAGGNTLVGEFNAFQLRAIPEPSTYVLLVAAGLSLIAFRCRRVLN